MNLSRRDFFFFLKLLTDLKVVLARKVLQPSGANNWGPSGQINFCSLSF